MRRVGVVQPHPFHEFAIGCIQSRAIAEPAVLDLLVSRRAATRDVLVDEPRAHVGDLDRDGAEAMGFDQPLEEAIAEDHEFVAAVQRLAESEYRYLIADGVHHPVDGDVESSIEGIRNGLACDQLVKRCKYGPGRFSAQ